MYIPMAMRWFKISLTNATPLSSHFKPNKAASFTNIGIRHNKRQLGLKYYSRTILHSLRQQASYTNTASQYKYVMDLYRTERGLMHGRH